MNRFNWERLGLKDKQARNKDIFPGTQPQTVIFINFHRGARNEEN